jgi:hypothetical protein
VRKEELLQRTELESHPREEWAERLQRTWEQNQADQLAKMVELE